MFYAFVQDILFYVQLYKDFFHVKYIVFEIFSWIKIIFFFILRNDMFYGFLQNIHSTFNYNNFFQQCKMYSPRYFLGIKIILFFLILRNDMFYVFLQNIPL